MYPQHGKNLGAAQFQVGYIYTDPSDLWVCMSGVQLSLRGVQVGRCGSKAFGVAWDSAGGLCSHRDISGTWQCFECCVQAGEHRQHSSDGSGTGFLW